MAEYIEYAKIPMRKNDIGAKTLGEYFEKLLLTLWNEQEDFSGKRPFGNSGWEYDVYAALISAGVVDGNLDEEGYVADVTYSAANDVVGKMINAIFANPTADVVPKSEVEMLQGALKAEERHNELTMDMAKKALANAKADVAREIFAEIAEKLEGLFDFFRQDGCIRESSAIMLAISEIAELKKKYT